MYDLIILGAGPAGYYAAEKAAEAGMSVVLIEKSFLGGVCLNEGCIPSKTLLYSSKLFKQAKISENFGVIAPDVSFNMSTVISRKEKIVSTLRNGIAFTLKKNSVVVEPGNGIILPKQNDVFNVRVGEKIVEARRLLICTGSEPVVPPIPGAQQPFVVTNKEILSSDSLPKNLVVIGGGAIGLEMACFFVETGSTVTVVELLPSIAGNIDNEISQLLKKELEKTGIRFLLKARAAEIGDKTVVVESDGARSAVPADIVLMSVGRKPITRGFGLEDLGVAIENNGIKTDARGRTNVSGVWAAGDVNGVSMLAHTAYREAQVCIDDMAGKTGAVNYDAVPLVIYTHPEVACVGLTEEEAGRRGLSVVASKLPLSYNGRFYAENEGGKGICKAVIDKSTKTLVGLHMVGGSCSEIIYGAAAMIENKQTVEDIRKIVFPHPTVSEIIKDTVLQTRF
ncbi:MAG: dihydrolipoyl dehydrogenase [Chitinivibrionales bacterium]